MVTPAETARPPWLRPGPPPVARGGFAPPVARAPLSPQCDVGREGPGRGTAQKRRAAPPETEEAREGKAGGLSDASD